MALQKDYINALNQTIPDCYWKIGSLDGFIGGKTTMVCKLYCYENKEDADLNQNELFIHEFDFIYQFGSGANIYIQAYEQIKEDSVFADAIDV